MGYNTQVLILNDALDRIEKNPEEFVQNLVEAIGRGSYSRDDRLDVSCGGHANAASVIPTQHADVYRVLVSHGNWLGKSLTVGTLRKSWNVPRWNPSFGMSLSAVARKLKTQLLKR